MAANRKLARKIRFGWAFAWGVFPDVFAFLPMFVVLVKFLFSGRLPTPRLLFSHALQKNLPEFSCPKGYTTSATAWLSSRSCSRWCGVQPRRPALANARLALAHPHGHSHTRFRRAPHTFLWPLSSYRFSGIWWSQHWFMVSNYSALAAAYLALLILYLVSKRQATR